jgi:hypothetical protein
MVFRSLWIPAAWLLLLAACDNAATESAPAASAKASADSPKPEGSGSEKPAGPKEKSITAKFCLGDDGTSQDCGISCKVDKDPDTCAKWAEKTKALCAKITKAQCQEICEKDENPTACELAKAMK